MTTRDPREYLTSEQNSDASKVDSTVLTTAEYSYQSVSSNSERYAISAAETSTKSPTDFTSVLGNVSYSAVTSGTDGFSESVVTTSGISTASGREASSITRVSIVSEYSVSSVDQQASGMDTTIVADNSTQPFTDTIATMDITSTPTAAVGGTTTNSVIGWSTPLDVTSKESTTNGILTKATTEYVTTTNDVAEITTQERAATTDAISTKSITSSQATTTTMNDIPTTTFVKTTTTTKQTTAEWTTHTPEERTTSSVGKLSPSSSDEYGTTNAQTVATTSSRILGLEPLHFYLALAGVVVVLVIIFVIVIVCVVRKKKKRKAKLKAKENSAAWISRSNAGVALGNISYRTSCDDEDPEQPASSRLSGIMNAPTVNIFANQNDAFEEERTSQAAVSRSKSSSSPKSSHDKTPERKPKGLTAVSVPIITPKMEGKAKESSEDEPASSSSFHSNDSDEDKRQKSFLYQPMSGGDSVPSATESNTTDSVDPPSSTTTEQVQDDDTIDSNKDSSNSGVISPVRPAPPPPVSSKLPVAPTPPPTP